MKKFVRSLQHKHRLHTAASRPLPDFLIIGAQKAGTTSLYSYLQQHPQLVSNVTAKEVHFFDTHWSKGVNWYRSNFPVKKSGKYYFEATPSYLLHPHAPSRSAATIPDAKLIILVRNPIDRAYSSYQHQRRAGREDLTFEEAIAKEKQRISDEYNKMLEVPTYSSLKFRRFSYIERGKYTQQILHWSEYYHRENMLIIESESLWQHTQEAMSVILEFLGVSNIHIETNKKHNTGNYSSAMSSDTREMLKEYYAPYNQELYNLVGKDFSWE